MENDYALGGKVLTRVWLIRFAISVVATAIVAWNVSFWVADYVVRANIAGLNATFSGIQSTLDQINTSIQANTAEVTKLTSQSASQGTEISYIRRDLGNVQTAMQDFGIRIPVVEKFDGGFVINTGKFEELLKIYNLKEGQPIFLEIDPKAFAIEK